MNYPHRGIKDGRLLTPGVDWGGPLTVKHQVGRYVVTHTRGNLCWAGVGRPRRYVPAKVRLIHLDDPRDNEMRIAVFTLAGRGKARLKSLITVADNMAAEETTDV